jgi:hypothetical protein
MYSVELFVNHELDEYVRQVWLGLKGNNFASPYYLPDKWNPHCTLATKLTSNQLVETFNFCLKDFKPIDAAFESVGLVEINFEGDRCVNSPTILTKEFL